MLRALVCSLALVALAACASTEEEAAVQEPVAELVTIGAALAEQRCSTCHAVGAVGDSPVEGAPRFRSLAVSYPFETLEIELREGIHVGDAQMPAFHFTVDETDALIAYLRAIQVRG